MEGGHRSRKRRVGAVAILSSLRCFSLYVHLKGNFTATAHQHMEVLSGQAPARQVTRHIIEHHRYRSNSKKRVESRRLLDESHSRCCSFLAYKGFFAEWALTKSIASLIVMLFICFQKPSTIMLSFAFFNTKILMIILETLYTS